MGVFRFLAMGLLSLSTIFSACKNKKGSVDIKSDNKAKIASQYTKSDLEKWPTPYWIAKAKVSVQHPDMNVSFNLTMRAEQGKALWFSANAFGIMEVARGLVTRDSIFTLDKFNNRLYVGGMKGLENYIPVPLGIIELQHFMMGRVFWDSLIVAKYQKVGDSTYINGNQGDIAFSSAIWMKYFLHMAYASATNNTMNVRLSNSEFRPSGGTQVAFKKSLKSSNSENGKTTVSGIDFDFSKFDFVETLPEMPFDIPKDAERQVLR